MQGKIMKTNQAKIQDATPSEDRPAVTGAEHKTLEAIFRHPSAHNLEWTHVVALIKKIGEVDERANSEFAFHVGGELHLMRKPHSKDLTEAEVIGLRKFLHLAGLDQAGWSPDHAPQPSARAETAAPALVVVMDHHEARIYRVDGSADDPSSQEIKPYDPHHFQHHLAHKDQDREKGQRTPEDPAFYKQIAQAMASGGQIVVIGHGTGKSNAAHHLTEYVRAHDDATFQRIASEVVADLSSTTTPQLLKLAQDALS
jgi:hypothetical protein